MLGRVPQPQDSEIVQAAEVLMSGGLALIPTETVYGLGVAAGPLMQERDTQNTHDAATSEPLVNGVPVPPAQSGYRRIFTVKQRNLEQTVPWLVAGADALDAYGRDIDPVTRALAQAFWPGALTLIVRAQENVPAYMQAADGTVALRCSASPVVAALIAACKSPLATTSANTHGKPAPASFDAIEPSVLAGVDVALDAGATPCQDASTIVSCLGGAPSIIRVGALAPEAIQRVADRVAQQATDTDGAQQHKQKE